jgi:hypothetical protein
MVGDIIADSRATSSGIRTPAKIGRCGTHDYKRNGTKTLFAALDVLEGEVIGRCMLRTNQPDQRSNGGDLEKAQQMGGA